MKRTFSIVATAATLCAANAVAAAEHTILILQDTYFPQITYLNDGDTVRFINGSGTERTLISRHGHWELGPIPVQGEVTMTIDTSVQKTFYDKDSLGADGEYAVEGNLSFSPAPLN